MAKFLLEQKMEGHVPELQVGKKDVKQKKKH